MSLATSIAGVVARLAREAAPDSFCACYLYGSQARDGAVAGSDIDIAIILHDSHGHSAERVAAAIGHHCKSEGIPIDAVVCTAAEAAVTGVGLFIANGKLIAGDDVVSRLPPANPHRLKHNSLWAFTATVADLYGGLPVRIPLSLGPAIGGESTCRFVKATVAAARGELLLTAGTGLGVGSGEAVALYRESVGGPWVALVEEVFARCRTEWNYALPPDITERAILTDLRCRAVDFHARYFALYAAFLRAELACDNPTRRRVAATHLRAIGGNPDTVGKSNP